MPHIKTQPKVLSNGDKTMEFIDVASTTSTKWTFGTYDYVKIKNKGMADISVSVGPHSNVTINPGKEWEAYVYVESITVQATTGSQQIAVQATKFAPRVSGGDMRELQGRPEVQLNWYYDSLFYDASGREIWTDAVQAAVDSLPVIVNEPLMRNGKVTIGYGKHRMGWDKNGQSKKVTVPLGVSIEGNSVTSLNVNPWSRDSGSIIIPINTTGPCLEFNGEYLKGSGMALRNLKFTSVTNGVGQNADCVVLNDVFYMPIENVIWEQMDVGNCLLVKSKTTNSSNWIMITNCLIKNVGDFNTLHTYGRGIFLSQGSDCHVVNTPVESCGGTGISIGGKNNKIIHSWFDLNNLGIYLSGSDNMIINTSTKINYRNGIVLDTGADRTQLIGGRSVDNNYSLSTVSTNGYGIQVIGAVSDLQIANYTIGHTGSASHMDLGGITQNGGIYLGNAGITKASISDIAFVGPGQGDYGPIYDPYNLMGTSAVRFHSPEHPIIPHGTTAQRPTSPFDGELYRDDTLGKIIVYYKTGTVWKDAMNNTV